MRSKSNRKPLQDVGNRKPFVQSADVFSKPSEEIKEKTGGDSLDRLLLVHSDLSSLLQQIEEIVVQAVQSTSDKAMKEINQFADMLNDMHTTLKLWVPKFQKAISIQSIKPVEKKEHSIQQSKVSVEKERTTCGIESPEQTKWESLVSPSPLVSWRAECNTEGGKQLFLLTPLPQTKSLVSKLKGPSAQEKVTSKEIAQVDDVSKCCVSEKSLDKAAENLGTSFISPKNYSERNCSVIVMTPCLKMSPPKSCLLLEPVSEFSKKKNQGGVGHKSTPFPVGFQISDSDESIDYTCDDLKIKYPELFGISMNNLRNKVVKKVESPDWNFSPPKTCAIMEPVDDKLATTAADHNNLSKIDVNYVESTPMVNGLASNFRMGKHPGENTLKKELWMKFDAASTQGIPVNSTFHNSTRKGFLDLLEEESDP